MAITQVGRGAPKYIGASTDTKPTHANPQSMESPIVGSTFFEYDTNKMFVTYDGTNWVEKNTVGHDKTGIGHGVKTVSTNGTDEALAASTAAKVVIIQAQSDNTSAVAVGASGVDATVATGNGLLLYAGDWSPPLEIDNLADVYVDALVAGEGVRYLYLL